MGLYYRRNRAGAFCSRTLGKVGLAATVIFAEKEPLPSGPGYVSDHVGLHASLVLEYSTALGGAAFTGGMLGLLKGKPCPQDVSGGVDVGVGLVAAPRVRESGACHEGCEGPVTCGLLRRKLSSVVRRSACSLRLQSGGHAWSAACATAWITGAALRSSMHGSAAISPFTQIWLCFATPVKPVGLHLPVHWIPQLIKEVN